MPDEKRVITPLCRLSFPNLFQPRVGPSGGDPKYSCALVFEEGADLTGLKRAILAAAAEKWGADKARAMFEAGKLRNPIRTDWEERPGYPENSSYINCSSKQENPPGTVGPWEDPATGKPEILTDPKEFYPGVYVRADIRAFAYDVSGNKGVSFGLNNIQKVRDGDRFDSRVAAVDAFAPIGQRPTAELSDSDAAELDNILGMILYLPEPPSLNQMLGLQGRGMDGVQVGSRRRTRRGCVSCFPPSPRTLPWRTWSVTRVPLPSVEPSGPTGAPRRGEVGSGCAGPGWVGVG
jgi:hypothetical protein